MNKRFVKLKSAVEEVTILINKRMEEKGLRNLNRKLFAELLNPYYKTTLLGRGVHKTAYYIRFNDRELVLKIGKIDKIKEDWETYNNTPKKNHKWAKIYWVHEYCMLQKYIKPTQCRDWKKALVDLKKKCPRLTDIRHANCGWDNNKLKIHDADLRKKHKVM